MSERAGERDREREREAESSVLKFSLRKWAVLMAGPSPLTLSLSHSFRFLRFAHSSSTPQSTCLLCVKPHPQPFMHVHGPALVPKKKLCAL